MLSPHVALPVWLTRRRGLLGQADARLLAPATWQGWRDTLGVLDGAGGAMPEAFRDRLDALSASPPTSCGEALEALAELVALAHPSPGVDSGDELEEALDEATYWAGKLFDQCRAAAAALAWLPQSLAGGPVPTLRELARAARSEEHTSELQSLMRISYAVFCLKKKKNKMPN